MKHIKLLLLALPLLLCGCDNKQTNTTTVVEPAYKQEFYTYLENNFNIPDGATIITVEFHDTEAHTFDYDYVVADVYYTIGSVWVKQYLIAVSEGSIYQVAEVHR